MNKALLLGIVGLVLTQLTACNSINNKSVIAKNDTIVEKNASCMNEFAALQHIDPENYQYYLTQFKELNDAYQVYKQNANLMNKDAKEMLGLELDNKLQLVCARIKSAGFQNMTKRAQDINKI